MDLTVVLPAKDEADGIAEVLLGLVRTCERDGIALDALVVDDGSGDDTAAVALALGEPAVRVLRIEVNRGRAHAIATGFAAARGWAVAVMDADGQYDPGDLPALLRALRSADVANGVRVRRADNTWRRLVSRTYNLLLRAVADPGCRDANSGLKMFRRDALERLDFDPQPFIRGHRVLLALARARGLSIIDVPVRHYDRRTGRSYIRPWREAVRTLRDLRALRRELRGAPLASDPAT